VFLGTTAVRTTLPAASKAVRLEAERVVLGGGIGATLLRPTMIYGAPGDRNVERLIRFTRRWPVVPILGRGAGRMQPTHVEDVAAAVAACLPRADLGGAAFDVPGPLSLTFEAFVRTVGAVLGLRRWYPHVPRVVGRLVASREQLLRLDEDKSADPGPAAAAFGYAPRPLEDGLRAEARALGCLP
jgi:nucleoside-diphosphate-sugar epimerase